MRRAIATSAALAAALVAAPAGVAQTTTVPATPAPPVAPVAPAPPPTHPAAVTGWGAVTTAGELLRDSADPAGAAVATVPGTLSLDHKSRRQLCSV